jgi:hypothetical protein
MTELELQKQCVKYVRETYPHVRIIANNFTHFMGELGNKNAALSRMRSLGYTPHQPDLIFAFNGDLFMVELKNPGTLNVLADKMVEYENTPDLAPSDVARAIGQWKFMREATTDPSCWMFCGSFEHFKIRADNWFR